MIASFSSPDRIYSGEVWLFPQDATLEGYQRIFRDPSILIGYRNSALYAVLDIRHLRMQMTCAGHFPPLLLRGEAAGEVGRGRSLGRSRSRP